MSSGKSSFKSSRRSSVSSKAGSLDCWASLSNPIPMTRDAPSLEIAQLLLQRGARVRAYDPIAMPACQKQNPTLKITYCASVEDLAHEADGLILVTEWQVFRDLELSRLAPLMACPILIDGRNLFQPHIARAAGFDYAGIGQSSSPDSATLSTPLGAC